MCEFELNGHTPEEVQLECELERQALTITEL